MSYSPLILFGLGLFGIVIHNLVKMNEINVKNNGNINILQYLKVEKFSILLSVCVVIVAIIVKDEIVKIEQIGAWLGISFTAIGYMAQSIIISLVGKGESLLNNKE